MMTFRLSQRTVSPQRGPKGGPRLRTWQVALGLAGILGWIIISGRPGLAQDSDDLDLTDLSIGEREPFDRITLNAANDNAVLDVYPLEFPGGRPPESPAPGDYLRFRLVERPQHLFEAPWSAIEKVETYADLLLAEAQSLIAAKRFDEAYPALARLLRDYPKTPGLPAMQRLYLYDNARQLLAEGRGYAAMAVLDELRRLDADYRVAGDARTADDMIAEVLDGILARYMQARDFTKAEQYMELIRLKYGSSQQAVVDRWEAEIEGVAKTYMADAQRYFNEGDGRRAHEAVRKMFGILRDVEGGKELAAQILERFPLVLVAVPQTATQPNPTSLNNWSSRRLGRLLGHTLLDYAGQGQDGGVYELPQGEISLSEDRLALNFTLRPQSNESFRPPTDIYELSRRLFQAANPQNPDYIPAWARLLKSLEIEDEGRLRVDLRFPHVLPESFLTLPLDSPVVTTTVATGTPARGDGVYVPIGSQPGAREQRFQINAIYRDRVDKNWPEIVEQLFESHQDAANALERSDVDVIEQVFPGDIARLRENHDIVVERYELPVLHMIIPNRRTALMRFVAFRRALLYGTNRQLILKQLILGGAPLEGAEVTSGPFPLGIDESDPLNYAYNFKVDPIPYEPTLAQTLVKLAEIQLADELEKERIERGEATAVETPDEPAPIQLTLVHPAGDVPRIACQAIAKQLGTVGVQITLRELPPGVVEPVGDDWDLLFTEVVMSEPLVDARRLLGPEGLARIDYPPIELALRRLDAAESWSQARRRLYELHLLTYNEVSLLPLWQLPQYHARRQSLEGVGSNLQTLYDHVEAWELVIHETNQ